jgi:hypothetical protein
LTGSPVEQNRRAALTSLPQQGFANRRFLFAPIELGELLGTMIGGRYHSHKNKQQSRIASEEAQQTHSLDENRTKNLSPAAFTPPLIAFEAACRHEKTIIRGNSDNTP